MSFIRIGDENFFIIEGSPLWIFLENFGKNFFVSDFDKTQNLKFL